jgi:hypothetical protein
VACCSSLCRVAGGVKTWAALICPIMLGCRVLTPAEEPKLQKEEENASRIASQMRRHAPLHLSVFCRETRCGFSCNHPSRAGPMKSGIRRGSAKGSRDLKGDRSCLPLCACACTWQTCTASRRSIRESLPRAARVIWHAYGSNHAGAGNSVSHGHPGIAAIYPICRFDVRTLTSSADRLLACSMPPRTYV